MAALDAADAVALRPLLQLFVIMTSKGIKWKGFYSLCGGFRMRGGGNATAGLGVNMGYSAVVFHFFFSRERAGCVDTPAVVLFLPLLIITTPPTMFYCPPPLGCLFDKGEKCFFVPKV